MKVDVLVAEIGSTTTVVNAFRNIDSDNPEFWAQGQAPTSVLEGDVRVGLQGAIDDLCAKMGIDSLEYDEMLATSSAAGGLKMTVHGLVYDMTARAAKEAALGAGGIIHFVTAGKLRRTDLAKIKEIKPNLILICQKENQSVRILPGNGLQNTGIIFHLLQLKHHKIDHFHIGIQGKMKVLF